jgi:hypothetical protein
LIASVVSLTLDNESLAALPTVASAAAFAVPVFPSSAASLDSRAEMDALNCPPEVLRAVASGSLSLPAGTAVMAVSSRRRAAPQEED